VIRLIFLKTQNFLRMEVKYALITGAAGGLGKSFAIACAELDYNLILVDLPQTKIESLAAQIESAYTVRVYCLSLNFCKEDAVDELKKWVVDHSINLSLLINNVGVGINQAFESLDKRQISNVIDVNIRTITQLSYALLPILKCHSNSNIINVGSMAGYNTLPNKSIYTASKAFVNSFSLSLRMEAADEDVNVSLLCSGGMLTNIDHYWNWRNGGLFVKWSYMHPDKVATITLRKTIAGKAIIIPGFYNNLVFYLTRWLPRLVKEKLVMRKFKISAQALT
jgi:short-subunit dehydrogenase